MTECSTGNTGSLFELEMGDYNGSYSEISGSGGYPAYNPRRSSSIFQTSFADSKRNSLLFEPQIEPSISLEDFQDSKKTIGRRPQIRMSSPFHSTTLMQMMKFYASDDLACDLGCMTPTDVSTLRRMMNDPEDSFRDL